jgi:hypothetical protein
VIRNGALEGIFTGNITSRQPMPTCPTVCTFPIPGTENPSCHWSLCCTARPPAKGPDPWMSRRENSVPVEFGMRVSFLVCHTGLNSNSTLDFFSSPAKAGTRLDHENRKHLRFFHRYPLFVPKRFHRIQLCCFDRRPKTKSNPDCCGNAKSRQNCPCGRDRRKVRHQQGQNQAEERCQRNA